MKAWHKSLGIKGWCSTSNSSGNEQSVNCICTVLSTVSSSTVFVTMYLYLHLYLSCIFVFVFSFVILSNPSTVFAQFSQPCPRSSCSSICICIWTFCAVSYLCVHSLNSLSTVFAQFSKPCPCSSSSSTKYTIGGRQQYGSIFFGNIQNIQLEIVHNTAAVFIVATITVDVFNNQEQMYGILLYVLSAVPFSPMSFFSLGEQSESITALWPQQRLLFAKNRLTTDKWNDKYFMTGPSTLKWKHIISMSPFARVDQSYVNGLSGWYWITTQFICAA